MVDQTAPIFNVHHSISILNSLNSNLPAERVLTARCIGKSYDMMLSELTNTLHEVCRMSQSIMIREE